MVQKCMGGRGSTPTSKGKGSEVRNGWKAERGWERTEGEGRGNGTPTFWERVTPLRARAYLSYTG